MKSQDSGITESQRDKVKMIIKKKTNLKQVLGLSLSLPVCLSVSLSA